MDSSCARIFEIGSEYAAEIPSRATLPDKPAKLSAKIRAASASSARVPAPCDHTVRSERRELFGSVGNSRPRLSMCHGCAGGGPSGLGLQPCVSEVYWMPEIFQPASVLSSVKASIPQWPNLPPT